MAVNVALCQMNIAWEDVKTNIAHLRELLAAVELRKNTLVILPEAFATGFSMNAGLVWKGSSDIQHALKELATEKRICFLAGVATRSGNNAVLIGNNGGIVGIYTKIHPFSPIGEERIFPGGEKICKIDFGELRLSPFICYDLRFPEIFRQASAGGAQLFIVIANWPAKRDDHWRTLLKARAIENQAYVVGVNRVGSDPNTDYCGSSAAYGPAGEELVAPLSGEQIVQLELSADVVTKARDSFPALRDRRDLK